MIHNPALTARLILTAALAFAFPQLAAAYDVHGLVTDSVGEPEPFATFRIVNIADTTRLIPGVAGEDGLFSKTLPDAGSYRILLTAVGKQTSTREFELTPAEPSADLGQIVLRSSVGKELGEVTVTALRPIVSREIDRIGYDVQADGDAATSQLDEILNKVPLVSVDPDGTILVKGSSAFKVYKNGRPNKSMSNNAKEIFKSIPAAMIEKIEVITDPGAREDAEGTPVILNIVMMKNTITKGVIGNAGLRYATTQNFPMPNLWLSGQLHKVTVALNGGMYANPRRSSHGKALVNADYDQSGDHLRRTQDSRNKNLGGYFGAEASWEPDTLNLFTFSFDGYVSTSNSWVTQNVGMTNAAGRQLYAYRQRSHYDPSRYTDFNGAVNWQRSTRLKGETVTASYRISTTNQRNNQVTTIDEAVNSPVGYDFWNNDFKLRFIEHTGQLDWTRPINRHQMFDVGAKVIARRNNSDNFQNYSDQNETTVTYAHTTIVGALYADYRLNLDRFGFRAGVRYEFSRLKSDYVDEQNPEYSASLNDICPNAALSFNINNSMSLRAGYSSSINRPGISYLNPAVNYSPLDVSFGNPDLKSALNHSLSLNWSWFKQKFMVDLNAFYNFTTSGIIENRTISEENVTYRTYANNGFTSNLGASLYMRWSPTNKTTLSLNGYISHREYKNDNQGIRNSGINANVYLSVNQTLPWKLRLSAGFNVGYYPISGLYNESRWSWSNNMSYNLAINRTFLKEDRLTVGISASNPIWKKWRYSNSYTVNMPVTWINEGWYKNNLNISLNISYRFGSMRIQVKRTSKTIQNNDLIGGKN